MESKRKKFEKILNSVFDVLFNDNYEKMKWDDADFKKE